MILDEMGCASLWITRRKCLFFEQGQISYLDLGKLQGLVSGITCQPFEGRVKFHRILVEITGHKSLRGGDRSSVSGVNSWGYRRFQPLPERLSGCFMLVIDT